jgi:hypothetical protein
VILGVLFAHRRGKTLPVPGFLVRPGRCLFHYGDLLVRWLRPAEPDPSPASWRHRDVELPWFLRHWDRRLSWQDLSATAVGQARQRGAEVARRTLGDSLWTQLRSQGYLDVRSSCIPGLTYRLRIGRRVQLLWATPEAARLIPWPAQGYLCIQPTYPLPRAEFAAQLYLYLRDHEAEVIRVAIPQAADGPIRRVF